jgi:hypothetical protein
MLNVGDHHAVRRVPISTISLTGEFLGQEFESSLERDLIFLMAWNPRMEWFQVQPVTIPYQTPDGRERSYTPDLLVWFNPTPASDSSCSRPILCEVKYRSDLKENWRQLKHKFSAARAYAKANGWEFRIYTEDRIHIPMLKNVKFLWSYRFSEEHPFHRDIIHENLAAAGYATATELLDICYEKNNKIWRAEALWNLWCMVARGTIHCDLTTPLSMQTRLWINPTLK